MSTVMKVIAGVPIKGNTITRHRTALKRAMLVQGTVACSLGAFGLVDFARNKMVHGGMSMCGSLIGLYNVTAISGAYKNLKPQYDEIVKRAKQIFKK